MSPRGGLHETPPRLLPIGGTRPDRALLLDDSPRRKFGDLFSLAVTRKELRDDFRSVPFFYFWNAWLEKK